MNFSLGATSYVIAGDLVENARHLARNWAGIIQDMQLVLFDVAGGPSNLPDAATVDELCAIAHTSGLGYSVHLIRDLDAHGHGELSQAGASAQDVMARTLPLAPRAYVAHLDGKALRAANYRRQDEWSQRMAQTLRTVGAWCGGVERLAVENLEGYPPELVKEAARWGGAGRCVDVGHLWLDGYDPVPYLAAAQNLRVIHLHGVIHDVMRGVIHGAKVQDAGKGAVKPEDHQALDAIPPAQLDAVCRWLGCAQFDGVVTLEVFGADDFQRSLAAFQASWARVWAD